MCCVVYSVHSVAAVPKGLHRLFRFGSDESASAAASGAAAAGAQEFNLIKECSNGIRMSWH